ncbi:LysR substrate-binding domain-containing protein [Vibrio vulnificus]|uniref:LysR substrate-binding domain-containing protein n=1 Tax=Vibrio vulnificus TaxID=672 RepID=UPI0024E02E09|nr:LysR substrate-binding domain-containing protein [Vibrio vulnificus]MDK2688371.1 LysR substrate-binding domain-containing protein [Vibrio vulnificus]
MIEHPDAPHYLELYLALCGEVEQGLDRRQVQSSGYVNQLSQILLPVARGLGFTVLPRSAMSQFSLTEHLAIYPSAQRVEESLYLISKKARTLPARFEVVAKAIRQAL